MKIIFDVDNVLADSMSCFCRKASKCLHSTISKSAIKTHKIVGSIPLPPGEIFELQDQVWKEWTSLPPTEDDLDRKLRILRNSGFRVIVATSRPKRLTDCVVKWLRKMNIDYDSFYSLGPSKTKSEIHADALVDDAPEQIREFVRMGRTGFICNQPWNTDAKIGGAIRISKVDDVLSHYRLTSQKGERFASLLEFG